MIPERLWEVHHHPWAGMGHQVVHCQLTETWGKTSCNNNSDILRHTSTFAINMSNSIQPINWKSWQQIVIFSNCIDQTSWRWWECWGCLWWPAGCQGRCNTCPRGQGCPAHKPPLASSRGQQGKPENIILSLHLFHCLLRKKIKFPVWLRFPYFQPFLNLYLDLFYFFCVCVIPVVIASIVYIYM